MLVDSLIAPLLRVRLFQGLSPQQLADIARRAERIMYRDGAVVTEEGEAADAAVLIVAGETVRVTAGIREPIEPGSLIGELAMLIDHTFGSTVVAYGPVKALRLPRAAMHELMERDRSLAEHMVMQISSRLSTMLDDMRAVDHSLAAQDDRLLRSLPAPVSAPTYFPSQAAH